MVRAAVATLIAGTALLAAGCGGNDQSVPAATQWAGDVCTAVNTWRNDITSATSSLTSNPSRDAFEQAAGDAKQSTETLVDTLKGLGAPDTESGEQVRSTLDTLSTELQADLDSIQKALDGASSIQGLVSAIPAVSAAVATISSQLSAAVDQLASLRDVDDELRQSFADAESCDGLLPAGS